MVSKMYISEIIYYYYYFFIFGEKVQFCYNLSNADIWQNQQLYKQKHNYEEKLILFNRSRLLHIPSYCYRYVSQEN